MLKPLFRPTQTVYFIHKGQITSGVIVAMGKSKEQFRDKKDNLIGQVLTNNIYFIKGFPGVEFKESELNESVEELLK
jgi:hypothetical protein